MGKNTEKLRVLLMLLQNILFHERILNFFTYVQVQLLSLKMDQENSEFTISETFNN